jgi:hypothetical protein
MNSDLRMLREFGETRTPPGDEPPARLRHRVLSSKPADRDVRIRSSRPRLVWRLGAVGTAAAAVVAAVLVSQAGNVTATAPPPAGTGTGAGKVGASPEAVRVLQLAAHQVTTTPPLTARPDQFLLVESVDKTLSIDAVGPKAAPGHSQLAKATLVGQLTDIWRSVDGTGGTSAHYRRWPGSPPPTEQPVPTPGCRDGRQADPDRPGASRACTPKPAVQADLPTDTDGMLRYLYRPGDNYPGYSDDAKAFDRAGRVIEASMSMPAVQAAVFRAVAQIPGVTVAPGVVDAAGRRGIAVTRTAEGVGLGFQLIFDPKTDKYLGSNVTVIDPVKFFVDLDVRGFKPGDITSQTAILRVAIVDKAGQLP